MKLTWTARAEADLINIGEYISRDKPEAAFAFLDKLIISAEKTCRHPELGRIVPEFNDPHIRELLIDNYRLVYEIHPSSHKIAVLTVFDGSKLLSPP